MMRGIGEMPEWSNGTDSKSVVLATVPRVQIPISPPYKIKPLKAKAFRGFFVVPYFFIIPNSASSSSALAIALR